MPPKRSNLEAAKKVSSIEARRILAVLEDCRSRIEYALLLPSVNEFLEGRNDLDEEVLTTHAEFMTHQQTISSMITADGDLKQGRSQMELDEETEHYKGCARNLIRVMKARPELFAPLLQQAGNIGGSAHKLTVMMKELNEMMNLTFSTPVETDRKHKNMMNEINQRKKSSRECIDQLSAQLVNITQQKEKKVRQKEDQLDDIKQQLQQAIATEAALANEEGGLGDEVQTQEEALKQKLAEMKTALLAAQKAHAEEERKKHTEVRNLEEDLQKLLRKYDSEMSDLTEKIEKARVEADARESEYDVLKKEYDEIERQRVIPKTEEERRKGLTNAASQKRQNVIAAVTLLQGQVRKYLVDAPKIAKKKGKKGKKK